MGKPSWLIANFIRRTFSFRRCHRRDAWCPHCAYQSAYLKLRVINILKILYGVQGTGNGHIARARLMAAVFAKRDDVSVDYLFTGRDVSAYFDMHMFGEYKTKRGLSFVAESGALNRYKTIKNINLFEFISDVRHTDLRQYDLVLNDFEPVSAWADKNQKIPSLSISHQAAFMCDVPTEAQSFIDRCLTRYFAPTTFALGVHWYHFGQAIIPPFVPRDFYQDIATDQPHQNVFSLVYLPFESPLHIQQTLQPLSEHKFYCYHSKVQQAHIDNNVHWFPLSKCGFHKALADCSNVIANGGFELATECLSLGKALLIKPLEGQFEQSSNALMLRQLGISDTLFSLNTDDIKEWLSEHKATQITFPSNIDCLIDWILAGNWQDTSIICEQLWKQVTFPERVSSKLNAM